MYMKNYKKVEVSFARKIYCQKFLGSSYGIRNYGIINLA